MSHKSVLQECHLDICSFLNVFAFGFVGSIVYFLDIITIKFRSQIPPKSARQQYCRFLYNHTHRISQDYYWPPKPSNKEGNWRDYPPLPYESQITPSWGMMVIQLRPCQNPSKNTPPTQWPCSRARINAATTPKHKNYSKTLSPVALQARHNEKSSKNVPSKRSARRPCS